MIALFIEFFKSHWLGAGVLSMGIVLATLFSIEHIEIAYWKHQTNKKEIELEELRISNSKLKLALAEQNKAIEQAHQLAAERSKKAEMAIAAASKKAQDFIFEAKKIKSLKLPAGECQAMHSLIDGFMPPH